MKSIGENPINMRKFLWLQLSRDGGSLTTGNTACNVLMRRGHASLGAPLLFWPAGWRFTRDWHLHPVRRRGHHENDTNRVSTSRISFIIFRETRRSQDTAKTVERPRRRFLLTNLGQPAQATVQGCAAPASWNWMKTGDLASPTRNFLAPCQSTSREAPLRVGSHWRVGSTRDFGSRPRDIAGLFLVGAAAAARGTAPAASDGGRSGGRRPGLLSACCFSVALALPGRLGVACSEAVRCASRLLVLKGAFAKTPWTCHAAGFD